MPAEALNICRNRFCFYFCQILYIWEKPYSFMNNLNVIFQSQQFCNIYCWVFHFLFGLRPNVFSMELVKKTLQHQWLHTEKGSFPSWTAIICSFKSCSVSKLVTQYHIDRVSFLHELRQYRHLNVDISPATPLPSSAIPSQFWIWPSGFKFGFGQVDPQCKKIGSIWVGLVRYNWPNCPVHRAL